MDKLAINPQTIPLLESYISQPAHTILLAGDVGVGLLTTAKELAASITDPALISVVLPDEGKEGISIDSVRQLYTQTRTKHDKPLVIILDNADSMRHEAQNAVLKLLEEPTAHTHFILTSHYPQLLLATIRSRAQHIEVRPLSPAQSQQFTATLGVKDETRLKQILFIAEGRPAEMKRLAQDDDYFALQSTKAVDARTFLGSDTYDRLILIAKYSDREDAIKFLEMLARFAIHTLYRQPDTKSSRRLEALDSAIERINANGNVRTQLTRLVSEWA